MGNVLDGREQISLMDIDPKLSRPLLRVATITRVLTLPGLVPAEGLKIQNFTEFILLLSEAHHTWGES